MVCRLAWLLLIACVFMLPSGCNRKVTFDEAAQGDAANDADDRPARPPAPREQQKRRQEFLEADQRYENILAGVVMKDEDGEVIDERAAEARDWLDPKHPRNAMWKTSKKQTLELVDRLYQAGARKVYCLYTPADETIKVNLCAALLVELPQEAAARRRTLEEYNQMSKAFWGSDHSRVTDAGQKFAAVDLDP